MEDTITIIFSGPEFEALRTYLHNLGVMLYVLSIVGIIVGIVRIIAWWRIYSKAGEGGWKVLIPIYNAYVGYKICWAGIAFWIYVLLNVLSTMFFYFAYPLDQFFAAADSLEELIAMIQNPANTVFAIIAAVFSFVALVWHLVQTYKMAKVFGHGFGYFLGLLFFPTIFACVLGFGSSEYVGLED